MTKLDGSRCTVRNCRNEISAVCSFGLMTNWFLSVMPDAPGFREMNRLTILHSVGQVKSGFRSRCILRMIESASSSLCRLLACVAAYATESNGEDGFMENCSVPGDATPIRPVGS